MGRKMYSDSKIVSFSGSQATLLSSSEYRSIVGRGYDPNHALVVASNGDSAAKPGVLVSAAGVQDGGVLAYAKPKGAINAEVSGTARVNFAIIWW